MLTDFCFSHYCAKFPYVCCLLWETSVLAQIFLCVCFVVWTVFPCQTSSVSILTLRSLSVPIYAPKSLPVFLELPCQHNCCVTQFVKYICFLFSNTFGYESPFLEILRKIEKNMRFFSVTDLSLPMFGTEGFQSRLFSWKSWAAHPICTDGIQSVHSGFFCLNFFSAFPETGSWISLAPCAFCFAVLVLWEVDKNFSASQPFAWYVLMLHLDIRKKFFYNESIQSLEQPPQWHSGTPIAGGFSHAIAQGDR